MKEDETGTVEYLPDSDELFESYVNDVFGFEEYSDAIHIPPLYRNALDEKQTVIYNYLKEKIMLIADGSLSSTSFDLANDIGYDSLSYTAEELGVSANVSGGSITEEANNAMRQKVITLLGTLLLDIPYHLYWFDKETGYRYNLVGVDDGTSTGVYNICLSKIRFFVSSDYSKTGKKSTYDADTQKTGAATMAAQTAQLVVAEHAFEDDYDKLKSYKDYIIEATDYNYNAGGANYGNPWQLIWVFDGDPETKVVCEGYSKAFQYLCDQSRWHNRDFECRSVVGYMDGGAHMWNVVAIDGNNYLVDVTNSEYQFTSGGGLSYSPGCAGKLFMAGATSGSVNDGYVISWDDYTANLGGYNWNLPGDSITYIYNTVSDQSTTTVYEESELALSSSYYYYGNSGVYHHYCFSDFYEDDYGRPVASYECDACGLKKNFAITKTEVDPYCFSYETSKDLLDTLLNTCGMGEEDFSIHYEIVMADGLIGTGTSGNPTAAYNVFSVVAAYDGDTALGGVVIHNPIYIKNPEYSFALTIPDDWKTMDWDQYSIRVRLIGDDVKVIGIFKPDDDTVSITAEELGDFELELVKLDVTPTPTITPTPTPTLTPTPTPTLTPTPIPTATPTPAISGFSDVQDKSHPYYNAIYWAADEGITKGYSDGTFGINRSCTRGEMMMFLWRFAGKPEPKKVSKSPFNDVPKTHTFYKPILWGYQEGITKGYSDGSFGIKRNVSRGEAMMFLWRLKGKPAPKAVSKIPFKDVPTSHAFYKAILWGSQKNITKGYTSGPKKGNFGINDNCTRGQIVTFLYRANDI